MALGQESFLRRNDLSERIGCGDQWPDLAALDDAHEGQKNLGFEHGAADELQIFQVECPQVEIDNGS